MTKPIARDPIYRRRAFDADIIELCVRWYITYRLSYRDLVEMMAERGIKVAHSTILRWVTRYVPEFEKRWLGSRRRSAPRGEWTRPTFRSRRSGTTCVEPWTSRARPSTSCFDVTVASRPHRLSFGRRLPRRCLAYRARSRLMATYRAIARCGCCAANICAGGT